MRHQLSFRCLLPFSLLFGPAISQSGAEIPAQPNTYLNEVFRQIDTGTEAAFFDHFRERFEVYRQRLVYDCSQEEFVLRAENTGLTPDSGNCKVRERNYHTTGGVFNWITLQPGLDGHYEITRNALSTKVKPAALAIIADAARDPDFFYWETPAAHGQTHNNALGQPDETPEVAMEHFITWVSDRSLASQSACKQGQARLALYHLGLALHAVEDLVAHDGRTNAEHAFNVASGQDPDDPKDEASLQMLIDRSKGLARYYWDTVAEKTLAGCSQAAQTKPGKPLSWEEKRTLLRRSRDLTKESYCHYIDYGQGRKRPRLFQTACNRAPQPNLPMDYPVGSSRVVRWSKVIVAKQYKFESLVDRVAGNIFPKTPATK